MRHLKLPRFLPEHIFIALQKIRCAALCAGVRVDALLGLRGDISVHSLGYNDS
jgi:hypothetical protein